MQMNVACIIIGLMKSKHEASYSGIPQATSRHRAAVGDTSPRISEVLTFFRTAISSGGRYRCKEPDNRAHEACHLKQEYQALPFHSCRVRYQEFTALRVSKGGLLRVLRVGWARLLGSVLLRHRRCHCNGHAAARGSRRAHIPGAARPRRPQVCDYPRSVLRREL